MDPFENFRSDVCRILEKAGIKGKEVEGLLERPPQEISAELALPCFVLAKKLKKNPVQIAGDIAAESAPLGLVNKVDNSGPYLNFYADWGKLGGLVLKAVLSEKGFGSGKGGGKVMVEYAQPNTHKAFHIGHVRNISIGESLSRILEFSGNKVVRCNYQGDIGPHVAKCLWGILNLHKGKLPSKNIGRWLGEVYAEASQKTKDNEKLEKEVEQINKDLYAGEKKIVDLWKKTRQLSLDYFEGIYRDFGAKFDRLYFESEVEKDGIKISEQLLMKGVAKESEGAIVVDLQKMGLGVWVLVTKNRTPLYSAKDLALAEMQFKEYNPDRIVHVVGSEQILHFRQLFIVLGMTRPDFAKREHHLTYELVNLPTGKMKSREGHVIVYEDLKDELVKLAVKTAKDKNPKISAHELEKVAGQVALGAIKYEMLNQSPEKVIIFDWDRALSFEGNTAPYIQYSYTRAGSILKKGKVKSAKTADASLLKDEKETALLKQLAQFPETVGNAARDSMPHYIASYAHRLAALFNEFYQSVPVLKAEGDVKGARVALVAATMVVLKKSLELLGIEAPEKM